jgi:UDP-N-acetylmuramyl tripeptide synthase
MLRTPLGAAPARLPLIGVHNVRNALAAAACAIALGWSLEVIVRGMEGAEPLPGRLEPVAAGTHFPVFVDYAHTPDALEQVLLALREVGEERRLVVVFGCGGDRDPGKRAPMGEVVGRLADVPIITRQPAFGGSARRRRNLKAARPGNPRCTGYPDREAGGAALADERCLVVVAGKGMRADPGQPESPLRRSCRDPGACPAERGVMRRSVAELATLLGARLEGEGGRRVTGVAIDSRAVRSGYLFVALPGERVDGHEFVAQAAGAGAAAALVSRPVGAELPRLVVADTLAALQRLARAERAGAAYRLAAVTGSIGKTTTKEFLVALLATTFSVGFTSFSSHSRPVSHGPATVGGIAGWSPARHEPRELDRLGAIAEPDALAHGGRAGAPRVLPRC